MVTLPQSNVMLLLQDRSKADEKFQGAVLEELAGVKNGALRV